MVPAAMSLVAVQVHVASFVVKLEPFQLLSVKVIVVPADNASRATKLNCEVVFIETLNAVKAMEPAARGMGSLQKKSAKDRSRKPDGFALGE